MSADLLREAAALMRERAEAAPVEVWGSDGQQFDSPSQPFTTYVASWHPAVALAVADWLDHNAGREWMGNREQGDAYAVARAYLGRDA